MDSSPQWYAKKHADYSSTYTNGATGESFRTPSFMTTTERGLTWDYLRGVPGVALTTLPSGRCVGVKVKV